MLNINERVENLLDLIFQFTIWITVLFIPLVFWNFTSEFFETPKFILLLIVTGILIILWLLRFALTGKLSIIRTPLDLPLLLLLIVFIISTFFAQSRPIAIFGNLPRLHGGLASIAALIVFYFVLVSNLRQVNIVKQIITLLVIGGVILSVFTLASYAGLNLLFLPWTSALNFSPTGASFTTAALLAMILPFPLLSILQSGKNEIFGNLNQPTTQGEAPASTTLTTIFGKNNALSKFTVSKIFSKILLVFILSLFTVAIVLTGSIINMVAAGIAFALVLFVAPPLTIKKNLSYIVIPIIIAAVIAFISFTPIGGSKNYFYKQAQNFPREMQLPFNISWKISISSFRDSPIWGSGPASYLFNFTAYKPIEFNSTKFWSVRFDQAFNEYLQLLGTTGALGLIALLLLTTLFVSVAFKAMVSSQSQLGVSLAISGVIFFILLALHASTFTLWVIGLIILAGFMATYKNITKETFLSSGSKSSTTIKLGEGENFKLHLELFPAILLLIGVGLVIFVYYSTGKIVLADYHHRQALNAVSSGQGLVAYNELIAAEKLNPYLDLYRTDLAQTNFALANAIATAKGPTESSPAGSLTDQDKQNIQTLLSQAINEGRAATVLNPNNPANWEILASIYRQISGVAQNALTFSLDAYGRAIEKDPLNPILRLTVGGIYYSAKNYDMAIRFYTDAINLKPDFANAYYNLAITLKDKGDLLNAAAGLEKTISLLDPKSNDYKTATEIYSDIRTKLASEAAKLQENQQNAQQNQTGGENSTLQNEATKNSSALQDKNLPKVLDLPKPENIASPEAVKKEQ